MTARPSPRSVFLANQWLLSGAQLFSGAGKAVGFAVGGLLAEELTGSAEFAGFAQTASIVGAGLIALPLARLAERRSRRYALSTGFAIAIAGAATILLGARLESAVVFFAGMLLFGAATATALQTRYAAADTAPRHLRGRALSIVVWAATVGSVIGPNLAGPGGTLGDMLGISTLAGPFALALAAYLLCVACTSRLRAPVPARQVDHRAGPDQPGNPERPESPASAEPGTASYQGLPPPDSLSRTRPTLRESLAAVAARPHALLGFVAIVLGQTIMTSVMVMTPVHMEHSGDAIEIIGIVISLHVLGMYALSPVFGFLCDRVGAVPVIWLGLGLFTASALVGIADDTLGSTMPRISTALVLLGLGWSACFIAGSTLLAEVVPERYRLTVQGAADSAMNLGAAVFAAAAGPLLAVGGFALINIVALGIVALGVAAALHARRLGSA